MQAPEKSEGKEYGRQERSADTHEYPFEYVHTLIVRYGNFRLVIYGFGQKMVLCGYG